MLYIFHGSDFSRVRREANQVIASLQSRQPDAELVRLSDSFSKDNLLALAVGQGLFFQKSLIYLEQPFLNKDSAVALKEAKQDLISSSSIFVVVAGELEAATIKSFTQAGAKLTELNQTKVKNKEFNPFVMSDKLLRRDRQGFWLALREAKQHGAEAEAIFGTLWWQVKTLVLAKTTANASAANLKPFVYNKAKNAPWNKEESEELLGQLIAAQTEARTGNLSLWQALELLALRL